MNYRGEISQAKDKFSKWNRYSTLSKQVLVGSLAVASFFGILAATTYENEAIPKTHINDINLNSGGKISQKAEAEVYSYQAIINYSNQNIEKELELSALALGIAGITAVIGEARKDISQ